MKRLSSDLNSKMLRPKILSTSDLLQTSANMWRATSSDPYLELSICSSSSRFVRLSAVICANNSRINNKIYLGDASQRSEERAIACSKPNLSMHSFVIDRDVDGDILRFDPHNFPGSIAIHALHIHEYKDTHAASVAMLSEIFKNKGCNPETSPARLHSLLTVSDIYEEYLRRLSGRLDDKYSPYQQWQLYVEKSWCNEVHLRIIKNQGRLQSLVKAENPFFTLVVPVYNPREKDLIECVDSIKSQTYPNWELILVDDASSNEKIPKLIDRLASEDERIKVISRSKNGHISAATNDGIRAAIGNFICLVDNDDVLSKIALEEIHQVLQERPGLKLIYSDEDLISDSGERLFPHFKTDWNPELLHSHNYITHLCCIEARLLKKLELRLGCEGSQDYDLMLRISEQVHSSEVYHISKILYHWRMSSTSTAASSSAKSYTVMAGLKALNDHIARTNKQAKAFPLDENNFYRLKWKAPSYSYHSNHPLVSIVIPTRNSKALVQSCIESIVENTGFVDYEILIANNDSDDPEAVEYFSCLESTGEKSFGRKVRIIDCPGDFNYSKINNKAIKASSAEFICLLNNDTTVINEEWLEELVSHASRPNIGCVGAKLFYPDNTIQHAGIVLGLGGVAGHSHKGWDGQSAGYFNRLNIVQQVAAVTGACLVIKRKLFCDLGCLDENNFPVAFNDVDLCLKAWVAGYRNIFTPFARLYHFESKTRGYEDTPAKKERFEKEKENLIVKWGNLLQRDPFYSDNLTLDREDFSIYVPPGHL